ncbi:hypothetical protein PHYPO_G00183180 [Pangasianodon hypophthalmus]|uniref:Uncharacterized protein n=1 Tax=Pangasianodon hypophthalmus TaxID=310915 RepID=A0A5N5PQT7_PANHP|nr:hypothetical protein PHYPO_G00183180 [Pangasianodon hypophthalmus]
MDQVAHSLSTFLSLHLGKMASSYQKRKQSEKSLQKLMTMVYSCLKPSVHVIGSRSTETLPRIKRLLKVSLQMLEQHGPQAP